MRNRLGFSPQSLVLRHSWNVEFQQRSVDRKTTFPMICQPSGMIGLGIEFASADEGVEAFNFPCLSSSATPPRINFLERDFIRPY